MLESERPTIALITGAGSPTGIGFAIARALGQAGHRIAITSMTARILERAHRREPISPFLERAPKARSG